jgi:hypothetical protein
VPQRLRTLSPQPPRVQLRHATSTEALELARGLTDRDLSLITYLHRHRVLTPVQITRVLFGSAHHARHRLATLHARGVLARFRRDIWPGSQPWRYTLGHVGAIVHAAATDAPLPKPSTITEKVLRLAHSAHTEHLLGVNDFFTTLAGHSRTHPGCELRQWWPETTTAEACGGIVRPDGYGEYSDPHGTIGFFYEHDTGTETLNTLTDKITKYGTLVRAGVGNPVLFELPNRQREQHFHAELADRWPAGPPVLVATAATTTAHPDSTNTTGHAVTSAWPAMNLASDALWLPAGTKHRLPLTQLPRTTPARPG